VTLAELPPGRAPLYVRFGGQGQPQGAYLEIDPQERRAHASHDGEVGGAVPFSVWHHRILRVSLSPYAERSSLDRALREETTVALLAAICDGHAVEWDGSNWIGHLTESAKTALSQLEAHLAAIVEDAQVWEPSDWLRPALHETHDGWRIDEVGTITAATTDEELEAYAKLIETAADFDNVVLEDVRGYLDRLRHRA